MPVGIIGGTSLLDAGFIGKLERKNMENRHGEVLILQSEDVIFIPRHGEGREIPPHKINHKANISAMEENNVKHVIGVNSVGSLKKEITPGSIVLADDYISLWDTPTFFDKEAIHVTPLLDEDLRKNIIKNAGKLDIKIIERGIYFQTHGPRLETKAEVRLMKNYADVVGMTMASEATLARELGLRYASICTVDNYAHGIIEERLDFEEIVKEASVRWDDIKTLLKAVVEGIKCY